MSMCLFVTATALEPFEIISMKFLWEKDMVRGSDEFENGYIPTHCGAQVAI